MQTVKLLIVGGLLWGLSSCKSGPNVFQQKLHTINQTLAQYPPNLRKDNEDVIIALKADVRKQGNSREGLDRVKRSELLHKRTLAVLDTIQLLRHKLSQYKVSATTPVRRLLWDNEGGRKLAIQINKHIGWLSTEFSDLTLPKFELITIRHFAIKEERTHLDKFAQLHFAYGSVTSTVALLNFWQNTLLWYEREVLKKLDANDICASFCCSGCGRIEAGVSTQADIIKLGETYEAKMFIASNASKANPRATYNGSPLSIKDGKAEIRVKVRPIPDRVKANKIIRYWQGSMTFKNRNRDTTLSLQVPYTVLRKSVYSPSLQKNK